MLEKLFENWEKEILRPILISLSTVLILFMVSLIFKPVRTFFFPPEEIKAYPLFCTAEPYISSSNRNMIVDFFIINRTDEEYSREELFTFLRNNNPDPRTLLSPDIELEYSRKIGQTKIGKIESAYIEKDFNDSKGDLGIDLKPNAVMIQVNNITPRAVMKVSIMIAGLPALDESIKRTTKGAVPLDFHKYEKGCYKR